MPEEDASVGHVKSSLPSSKLQNQIEKEPSLEIRTAEKCNPASTYSSRPTIHPTMVVNAASNKKYQFFYQLIETLFVDMIIDRLNIESRGASKRKLSQPHLKKRDLNELQPLIP